METNMETSRHRQKGSDVNNQENDRVASRWRGPSACMADRHSGPRPCQQSEHQKFRGSTYFRLSTQGSTTGSVIFYLFFFGYLFIYLPLKLLHLEPFPKRWICKRGRSVGRLCRLSHVAVCVWLFLSSSGWSRWPPPPPPLHLRCCSGFDIEGTSRPVVVPVPQTSVAGTLNLGEELFPDSERQRWETEIDEGRNRLEGKESRQEKHILIQEKRSDVLGRLVTFLSSIKREKPICHLLQRHSDLVEMVKQPCSPQTGAAS